MHSGDTISSIRFFVKYILTCFIVVINKTTCFNKKKQCIPLAVSEKEISIFDPERLRMCDDMFHMKHPSGKNLSP